MKRFRNLKTIKTAAMLCAALFIWLLAGGRSAKAAQPYNVSFNDPSVVVGNSVTVTMTVSPAAASVDIRLAYTSEFLSMTGYSGGLGNASISYNASSISINDYASSGAKTATYSFTFKALKAGTGRVTISEVIEITDANGDPYSASGAHNGNSAVTITQPPAASSEARLQSLTIVPGRWNQSFNPDVTEYTIDLDEYTDELTFQFKSMESHANVIYWTYTRPGKIAVAPGVTNFYIRSTAQDGNTQKQYHIVINCPEKPTEEPVPQSSEGPDQPTDPSETDPNESTEPEETTEPVPVIEIPAQVLEIESFPEDFAVPEGYKPTRMMDAEGTVYDALIPADGDDYDHYLVYGSKDGADPDLYAFFEEDGILRPFSLMIPETTEEPSTEETTTEEETTAEEETTEEETTAEEETTEAVTPEETQAPTTEPYRVNFLDGDTKVPGWVTTVAAALLAICLLTILLLLIGRRRDRKATAFAVGELAPLSPEEEKEFLSVSGNSLVTGDTETAAETPEASAEAETEADGGETAEGETPEAGEDPENGTEAFEEISEAEAPEAEVPAGAPAEPAPEVKKEIDIPL